LSVNRAVHPIARDGWAVLSAREWKDGDQVSIRFSLGASVIQGDHGNASRSALVWGPFVLAYDENRNPGLPAAVGVSLTEVEKPPFTLKPGDSLAFARSVRGRRDGEVQTATFVPFADAGADGGTYRVWLRAPGVGLAQNESLLADGEESRSRDGNQHGSINDGDPGSYVVTFNGQPAKEDWYAVTLATPTAIRRVVFVHGQNYHDGGWFDASAGKPQVQVQHEKGGRWETIGEVADYPATTTADGSPLKPGQKFTLRLASPVTVSAVRVVGTPASGDNPKQAFSSCGELEAFAE
jgi:hypothetical protein